VEWFDCPQRDDHFDNSLSKGSKVVMVHKLKPPQNGDTFEGAAARYESRIEVELTAPAQRAKLDELKTAVLTQCGWSQNMAPEHMVLAARDLVSHRWTVLEEEAKGKKQKLALKIFDRQILAAIDTLSLSESERTTVSAKSFETEWDRHCQRQHEEQRRRELVLAEDDDLLIGGIKINFNDSQNDSMDDSENGVATGNAHND